MIGSRAATAFAILVTVFLIIVAPMVDAADTPRRLHLLPEKYPRVDGSTSTQPLVALVACRLTHTSCTWAMGKVYPTTDPYEPTKKLSLKDQRVNVHEQLWMRIRPSGTHQSYTNLITRGADLILAARGPSDDELALAREKRVEIKTAPIALDAFVFIVNRENHIRDITVDQIRGIYTGKVTDWKELGGPKGRIQPYQRNRNSGSQEIMEKVVMRGREIVKAPDLEIPSMVGPFNAILRDKRGIGYTFYYFNTFMESLPEITMLGIQGVSPTPSTIQDRSYPFVTEVVVAWLGNLPGDSPAAAVRDWLLTKEGQSVVAESGYVPIRR